MATENAAGRGRKRGVSRRSTELLRIIGARMLAARERAGLSRVRLARAAGYHPSLITYAEKGHGASINLVYAIAKALGIPAHDLLPRMAA